MDVFSHYSPFIQDYIYEHGWQNLRPIQVAAAEEIFESVSEICKIDILPHRGMWYNNHNIGAVARRLLHSPKNIISGVFCLLGFLTVFPDCF